MVKYFCDKCGKELDPNGADKEIMFVTTRLRCYVPREWDDKPHECVLCHACTVDFCTWITTPPKETETCCPVECLEVDA